MQSLRRRKGYSNLKKKERRLKGKYSALKGNDLVLREKKRGWVAITVIREEAQHETKRGFVEL